MKTALFILVFALTGCASRVDPDPPAVSTAAVSQGIQSADDSAAGAQTAVAAADGHVADFRTRAQRIDDKAVVILRYWDSAR